MKIAVFNSFDSLPEEAVERFSYPANRDFLTSIDWYRCLFETTMSHNRQPVIYALSSVRSGIDALLFCVSDVHGRILESMTNFYSISYGPSLSINSSCPDEALGLFLSNILSESRKWTTIDLKYLTVADLDASNLSHRRSKSTYFLHSYFQYENWYLNVADRDFSTYYSTISSRVRNTIARKEKKFRKEKAIETKILGGDLTELESGIADYLTVYQQSWKQGEASEAFIKRLIRTAAAKGVLRLGLLYADGIPVAAQLWLTSGHSTTIYKLAYVPDFGKYSSGSILSREMFRYAIDTDRVSVIDYGIGSEAYKKDWMNEVQTRVGLRALNIRKPKGLLLGIGQVCADATRRLRRSNGRSP